MGRCIYGIFLNSKGHVIDDAILYLPPENLINVWEISAPTGV